MQIHPKVLHSITYNIKHFVEENMLMKNNYEYLFMLLNTIYIEKELMVTRSVPVMLSLHSDWPRADGYFEYRTVHIDDVKLSEYRTL